MAVWRLNFATSSSLSNDPPLPLAARFVAATNRWSVTFDSVLESGALDAGNWRIDIVGSQFTATTAIASGKSVSGDSTLGGPGDPSDTVRYTPPPADVLGLNGVPAAAFSAFPVTVV